MTFSAGEDGVTRALGQLTGSLGLCWALYGAAGQRLGGALPSAAPACAASGACPMLTCGASCPAAAPVTVAAQPPLLLVACAGSPMAPPADAVVNALRSAVEAHVRTEHDVQSTVRELTATYQELAIAYGIMETISLPASREVMAQALLAHVAATAPADGCCLLCLDESQCIQPLAVERMSAEEVQAIWRRLTELNVKHPAVEEPFTVTARGRQVLVSGLCRQEHWCGLVALSRPADQPFSAREAKLLQAAGRQAALALRNRGLVDDLQGMFISTIHALVAAIDVKDTYTCGHSRRVAQWAQGTARMLGLAEEEVEAVYMSGIVHDIGKIAVERAVLCKPGALTDEEWQTVRTHPEHGAGIINCIPQLQHLVAGVRHHHERADGKGYPLGLRHDQIPLASRIIAVCDTYDAMTSERSYRHAIAPEVALAELRANVGTQFSAPVVGALVETLQAEGEAA